MSTTADVWHDIEGYARELAFWKAGIARGRASVIHDRFVQLPAAGNPLWPNGVPAGSGVLSLVDGPRGGVLEMTTGAVAGSNVQVVPQNVNFGGAATNMTWIGPPVAIGEKHLSLFRFKLTTAPDAQTVLFLGQANPGALSRPFGIGYSGAIGTGTKFQALCGPITAGGALGVDLDVALDTNWHVGTIYSPGDGELHAFMDKGAEFSFVPTLIAGGSYQPYLLILNWATAAAQTVQVDDAIYVADSNEP